MEQAMVTLKSGQYITFSQGAGFNSTAEFLQLIFLRSGIKSLLQWLIVAAILALISLTAITRKKAFYTLSLSMVLIVPVWFGLNSIPNFRLGMHLVDSAAGFSLAQLYARWLA
ncbi:MAG: hypothetical protein U5L96_17250 [Owenweeksia sp.]|nr:hypothetical protein [Owenweeksia sp.]